MPAIQRLDRTAMTFPAGHVELAASEAQRLRAVHYNARLAEVVSIHDDLRILRIVPDAGMPVFEAGQFMTLGLGNWEPRVAGVDEERIDEPRLRRLAKRAYSISCSLLNENGVLRRATEFPYLEFYVVLVRHGTKRPPSLTPRLFALKPGDRLFAESRAAGTYTLRAVRPDDPVFFFATGTGEAPHNAMIAELLCRGHQGPIVSVVSVRVLRDAGYWACHEELTRRHPNYRYFVLTTRERLDNEPWAASLGPSRHLQDLIITGELERASGAALDPARASVFLCGNSEMIGALRASESSAAAFKPGSMLDVLAKRGFRIDQAAKTGNVRFERYW